MQRREYKPPGGYQRGRVSRPAGAYYHACPYCGCNIDPGERCDCQREAPEKRQKAAETGKGRDVA